MSDPSINIRNVPRDLRNKFKAYCARQGCTMTKGLIDLMTLAVGPRHPNEETKKLKDEIKFLQKQVEQIKKHYGM